MCMLHVWTWVFILLSSSFFITSQQWTGEPSFCRGNRLYVLLQLGDGVRLCQGEGGPAVSGHRRQQALRPLTFNQVPWWVEQAGLWPEWTPTTWLQVFSPQFLFSLNFTGFLIYSFEDHNYSVWGPVLFGPLDFFISNIVCFSLSPGHWFTESDASENWEVVDANSPTPDARFYLNVCHKVIQSGGAVGCPVNASICAVGKSLSEEERFPFMSFYCK